MSCYCCNLSMTNKSQTSTTGSLGRHCRTRLLKHLALRHTECGDCGSNLKLAEVMTQEPYQSAHRVFWIMDNCSAHHREPSRCRSILRTFLGNELRVLASLAAWG